MERKIEATGSVEVYQTQKGNICLKQEDTISGEEQFVVFPIAHAGTIVKWILEVKEEIAEDTAESEAD